jgi:hypothetical protein
MNYIVSVSLRVEGEWNINSGDLGTKLCYNWELNDVCGIGCHGFFGYETEADAIPVDGAIPRSLAHYIYAEYLWLENASSSDTFHIRAFAQNDTTVEWLLDQVVFLPQDDWYWTEWQNNDWERIWGTDSTNASEVDGGDGGDDGGVLTRSFYSPHDPWDPGPGLGDYQRKADGDDAEYAQQVTTADARVLVNTLPTPDEESGARVYGLHGVRFRASEVTLQDDFSRSISGSYPGDLGITSEGFGYKVSGTLYGACPTCPIAYVDGSGVLKMISYSGAGGTTAVQSTPDTTNRGASIAVLDEFIVSGKVRLDIDTYPDWRSSPFLGGLAQNSVSVWLPLAGGSHRLYFSLRDMEWWVERKVGAGSPTVVHGPIDASGWYEDGDWIGWKMEVRRYQFRVKLWDASGSEPGTWDYDTLETTLPFPGSTASSPILRMDLANYGPAAGSDLETQWDDLVIERDSYGETPTEGYVRLERPHGTTFGEIEIPYGAAYFVYWGAGDFTDFSTTYRLAYSYKQWNPTTAPEMQRMSTSFFYFRSIHEFLIPMNWRSSTREGGWKRVLKGNT